MADNMNGINNNPLLGIMRAGRAEESEAAKKKGDAIGQDEFLKMLVAQLQNQDPLDPMQGEEFAVNLAQFSQLERLISIDDKLGKDPAKDVSSLAAYLGQEVVLNSSETQVSNHNGGKVFFELGSGSTDVRVELLNLDGSVRETIELGALDPGKHEVELSDLETGSGDYSVRVINSRPGGEELTVSSYTGGVVTGFIPGDNPILLMGDREFNAEDIRQVNAAG